MVWVTADIPSEGALSAIPGAEGLAENPVKVRSERVSQCVFFVSGDVPGALCEARRLLKPGGRLLLSDVEFSPLRPLAEAAGFAVLHDEDLTALWREYYLEALWREEEACLCEVPRGKCGYRLLIAERRR